MIERDIATALSEMFFMQLLTIFAVFILAALVLKKEEKEITLLADQADPLAAIKQADQDIDAAVTNETTILNNLIAALKAAGQGNGFSPSEAASLAADLEAQVANLNTAGAAGTAALNPPAASPDAKKAS